MKRATVPSISHQMAGLFVVMVLVVGGCGMSRSDMMALSDAGATANVEASWSGPSHIVFGRGGKRISDAEFHSVVPSLLGLPKLRELRLAGMEITDRSVDDLLQLTSLYQLDLRATGITFDGLTRLQELPNLRDLNISDGQISERELATLTNTLADVSIKVISYPAIHDPR
ncbi:hypothetical protein BH09PLA1_BH09PLA1_12270 [soil metagenome]